MRRREAADTIAAIATPAGEGGIGIVRLSGPGSLAIAGSHFRSADGRRLDKGATHTIRYGRIVSAGAKPRVIDEVLVTVMRAPRSYTREDTVEINCHGGLQATKRVLDLMVRAGARPAEPGEFTKRAFLNGRIDLAQAEAVLDVIRARTESALALALDQLEGGLSQAVDELRESLVGMAAEIEASIDFPDEGIEPARRRELIRAGADAARGLTALIQTYGGGAILREGVLAIICGKPNAGKSSLMNLLLKRDRVIVSPIPGTTRDAVEETINLRGIPIRLVDTAGIAETDDRLEREGIARAKKYLEAADIAIVIFDASRPVDAADREIVRMVEGRKKVFVLNKCDLPRKAAAAKLKALAGKGRVIRISVERRTGIAELEKAIAAAVWKGGSRQNESAVVSNIRHKVLLDKALGSMLSVNRALKADLSPELVAIDLKEAIASLGLIIGKTVSDDILERIFERFCIGK